MSSKSEVFEFFRGGRSLSTLNWPEGVLTIIESIWNYGNLAYLVANTHGLNVIKIGGIWIFQGGRIPLLGGLHVTCNAHFRTRISYSSQKSCVKIWFGLVEPFKSYHLNFPWGQKPPIMGVACDLQCPFSDLGELFQSKVICVNLVWIGWTFQELSCPQTFFYGGGVYIWPVMPIFELGWAIPVKSHVWKFRLDWLKSEVC